MCGIIGFFGSPCPELESRYLPLLQHRGPDASGVIHGKNFSFGHTRLSILGLSDGDQPVSDAEGNVLVYNGEIYNCHQLQKEFLPTNFRSDSRILFELLKTQGHRILPRLRGMFAFAYLQGNTNTLLLARDPFGMKPLYVHRSAGVLSFSSELKALGDMGLDWDGFEEYLYFSNPLPGSTLYRNTEEVKAGEYWSFNGKSLCRNRFFQLKEIFETKISAPSELSSALETSLRAHILSDVPVGLLLSGGMDSSSLALAANKTGVPLRAYNLAYEDPDFDESPIASRLADYLGMEMEVIPFSGQSLREELEEALAAMDQPFGDPSFLPTYQLSRSVAKKGKVVLGGDGGDEIFYGYPTFQAEAFLQNTPSFLLPLIYSLSSSMGRVSSARVDLREKMLRFSWGRNLTALQRHSRYMCSGFIGDLPDDFFPAIHKKMKCLLEEEGLGESNFWEPVFFYYFRIYLANLVLVKTDRASMANSLEVRCPFLDVDFIKEVFRYPGSGFPVFEKPKQTLRNYLKDSIPAHLLHFQKKGFSTPLQLILPILEQVLMDRHNLKFPRLHSLQKTAPYWLYNMLVFLYFHPEEQAMERLRLAARRTTPGN